MFQKISNTFKRKIYRETKKLNKHVSKNSKVCMIVWNTFENDARVMKEAVSLNKKGKKVTVIAVHDNRRTLRKETKEEIVIKRVDRTIRKRKPIGNTNDLVVSNRNESSKVKNKSLKMRAKKVIFKFLRWTPKAIINVRFLIYAYKENAGIYHAHDLNTLIPTYMAAKLRGAKLIYDAHEISTDRAGWGNKRFWKKIENALIKKVDSFITTNQTRAEFFANEYNIEFPHIIRNVPPFQKITYSNKIREICSIPMEIPIILYQGGLQRERGLEGIIKAIPFVKSGFFVFIGDGALKPELLRITKELKLEDKICFLDTVPNSELLNYTSSADIGLQLLENTCFNHYSATSNKLHEYLMAELAIICSDFPEMKKVVEATKSGVLVNPEDSKLIAEQINKLVENNVLRDELKKNAKKSKKAYSWDLEERELYKIYGIKGE